jgi:hypothetical protein
VKEPDELLKISHLKSDTMPDPDEYMKHKDLTLADCCFSSFLIIPPEIIEIRSSHTILVTPIFAVLSQNLTEFRAFKRAI